MLNVVTSGDTATVGEVLTGDPRVDMISFTGSTAIGRRIMARGADTLKRVFLELGGKSANIILDDADFAVDGRRRGRWCACTRGQGCAITTRMLLPRSRYDEGVELLKAAFEAFPYGDPTDPGNMMGPLINARQRERVLGYIEKGKAEGARLLVGGGPPDAVREGLLRASRRCSSTSTPTRRSRRRRSSARCCAVIQYEDDDDAVRIANNSRVRAVGRGDERRRSTGRWRSRAASAPAPCR